MSDDYCECEPGQRIICGTCGWCLACMDRCECGDDDE